MQRSNETGRGNQAIDEKAEGIGADENFSRLDGVGGLALHPK